MLSPIFNTTRRLPFGSLAVLISTSSDMQPPKWKSHPDGWLWLLLATGTDLRPTRLGTGVPTRPGCRFERPYPATAPRESLALGCAASSHASWCQKCKNPHEAGFFRASVPRSIGNAILLGRCRMCCSTRLYKRGRIISSMSGSKGGAMRLFASHGADWAVMRHFSFQHDQSSFREPASSPPCREKAKSRVA